MKDEPTKKASKQSFNEPAYNKKQLTKLFPSAITPDGQLDMSALQELIGVNAPQQDQERFGLSWAGKSKVYSQIRQRTDSTLLPNNAEDPNYNSTGNIFIEGDNLEALKIIEKSYFGKVKMIYIDPPYNTGNDFVYKDKYATSEQEHIEQAGTHNEQGNVKRADGLTKNSKDKGRYHSNWLNMIYPRLHIARNLLKEYGVILVSIDDNEVHHLRMIMDEIFGEENFIAQIIWEKKFSPQNDAKWFSDNHDYILVYAREKNDYRPIKLQMSDEQRMRYKNPDDDPRGPWVSSDLTVRRVTSSDIYPVISPSGKEFYPPKGRSWSTSASNLMTLITDGRIWFGENGTNMPRIKTYLSENTGGLVPTTLWKHNEVGHNQEAAQELKKLFDGNSYFDSPKPVRLLKQAIMISTSKDDIVLDFFAGSGTTAHAVMDLNAQDGGNRKFILVQLPEETDATSEAYKAGYKTIADIARERIKRAGLKILKDYADTVAKRPKPLDINFKDSKVAPSNFVSPASGKQSQLIVDNIMPNTTDEQLLTQLRLLQGKPLNQPIETKEIASIKVFVQDSTCFVLQPNCPYNDLNKLLTAGFSKIVLLDRCFISSTDSKNFNIQAENNSDGIIIQRY
jgi:adenine-specific DNA-methyltransferase